MSAAAFGLAVLVTALAGVAAVLSSRVSERLRIPAPAFFLIAAAAAADLWPRLGGLSFTAVENVVSVALAVILFDGGMRVGWRRLRPVAGPTLWIGVAGTLVTAGGVAAAAHLALGLDWHACLLLGAALIIRNGRLVPVRPDTVLRAGDEAVVVSADPDAAGLSTLFTEPSREVTGRRGLAR